MNNEITIWIYGDIGDEVQAQPIVEQLSGAPDAEIKVRINSAGGSVPEAAAIFNALRNHRAPVRVSIEGLAASAASYVAMAGDTVEMAENAVMMIHDPWMSAGGNSRDLRQSAETLDKIAEGMRHAYRAKSGLPAAQIQTIMEAETWFTADEAKQAGFIDKITTGLAVAAHVDLTSFKNVPTHIARMQDMAEQTPNQAAEAKTKPQTAEAAVADFKAKEQARRDAIHARLSPSLERPGIREIYTAAMTDMSVSPDRAGEQALIKMGEGCEPLGGGPVRSDAGFAYGGGFGGHVAFPQRDDGFMAAARDGILMRYGIGVDEPHPAARDCRNMSVRDIAATCLSRAGKSHFGEGAKATIRAALTSSDFPNLLGNVGNKALIAGLESAGAATHRDTWTRRGELTDFKAADRVALSEAPDLKLVSEGGEITHGNILDGGAETIQAETYARIISISRKALINDDLGALTRVPRAMGLAAARTESDIVYGLLASNPTMRDGTALFDAAHGNLAATGANITIDELGKARAAMRKQRGVQGQSYLNVTPTYLVVGADRETEALQILAQLQPNTVANVVPDWVRQLSLVVDPRLDDVASGAWFLTGNPQVHDTIEVGYLDGRSAPSLEQNEDFDTLNLSWRVVFDFGVAALDWRALYRNDGQ